MTPDQDLRLTCVELALEYASREDVDIGMDGIKKFAYKLYRFIAGKDCPVVSAQIRPPHRVIARIRQDTWESSTEE